MLVLSNLWKLKAPSIKDRIHRDDLHRRKRDAKFRQINFNRRRERREKVQVEA